VDQQPQLGRGGVPSEARDGLARGLGNPSAKRVVRTQATQNRRQRVDVRRREEERRGAERLAVRRQVAEGDGGAAGRSFDGG
jgi:ribosomal protein L9